MFKKFFVLLVSISVISCKDKKIDLSGETALKDKDFFAAFKPINLPINIADTNITKLVDTSKVGLKLLHQFIGDSVFKKMGLKESSIIHSVGKIEKEKETYLLFNFSFNKKHSLVAFVFNETKKYVVSKVLLETGAKDDYVHSVSITKEPTFIITKEKMNKEKQSLLFTRTGWAFSSAIANFMTVVKDTNEDEKRNNTIINPIDTLPRKFKYSANYVQNEKNFIALRDGAKPNTYLFFLHIEKDDGECTGELKGELKMKSETEAIYADNGDPCQIDFIFNGNEINVKEQGSCGNYRSIKCFFDDVFVRKKEANSKKKK